MRRLETLAIIAHDMGIIFEFLGMITLVPLLLIIIFGEWDMLVPMVSVPLTFILLGVLISHIPRREYVPQLSVALTAAALIWLAIAAVGALPFVLGLHMSWTDSIFEAMSGWTGTGFTVIGTLDSTENHSLLAVVHAVGRGSRGDCVRNRHALPVEFHADPALPV